MNAFRIILLLLLSVTLGLYESVVSPFLPFPWNAFHPILGVLVLLVAMEKAGAALVAGVVSGFVLDVLVTGGAAFSAGRMAVIVVSLAALQSRVLTNRSLYAAVALVLSARMAEILWQIAAHAGHALFFRAPFYAPDWVASRAAMAWDAAFVAAGFFGISFFTQRFLILPSARKS